jgi:hypothetical protein
MRQPGNGNIYHECNLLVRASLYDGIDANAGMLRPKYAGYINLNYQVFCQ